MTEAVIYPTSVDLRANIDKVYDQSQTGACTAHAIVNALDAMYDNAGQSERFSRSWIWYWSRKFSGNEGWDYGVEFEGAQWALQTKGAVLESEWPWGSDNFREPPAKPSAVGDMTFLLMSSQNVVEQVKRKLAFGMPVILTMYVYPSLYALRDKRDWKTHEWDTYGSPTPSLHAVCIVGYDDTAGRFLVENSWGADWADGGFFGIPYADFSRVRQQMWIIDRIRNFTPTKAQGFTVGIPYLLSAEDNSNFTVRNKPALQLEISQAFEAGGMQPALDVCKRRKVTDKHLEHLFGWERNTVREFQDANPGFDWDGFLWATV